MVQFIWLTTLLMFMCQTAIASPQTKGYKNKALLWNAGKFFYNYRMEVSLMTVRYILEDFGFTTKDILHVKADNIVCNYNAVNCPSLRIEPEDPDSNLLRGHYESDYSLRDNIPEKYVEVLIGRYEPKDALNRRIERDENTNFFFYGIGHGGDLYFKIQDTEVVFAQQFADYMHDPAQKLKYREAFLLSDTCGAGSLFSLAHDAKNAFMMGTSGFKQKATSYDQDTIYSQPLNDKFMYHFKSLVYPKMQNHTYFSIHKLKSTITRQLLDSDLLTFNNIPRAESMLYLNEFMEQGEVRNMETFDANSAKVDYLLEGFFPDEKKTNEAKLKIEEVRKQFVSDLEVPKSDQ